MTYRKGHGNGAGQPRIEVLPPDELPKPCPGRVAKGGATKIKLARSLVLSDDWGPYKELAEQFRKHQCRELAKQAGGFCGAAPSTMIASAALQLAASRWMFDRGSREANPDLLRKASQTANDSRQNLLAAYELAVREAEARHKYGRKAPAVALEEALTADTPTPEPLTELEID